MVGRVCLPSQETRLVWKLFIVVPPENIRPQVVMVMRGGKELAK